MLRVACNYNFNNILMNKLVRSKDQASFFSQLSSEKNSIMNQTRDLKKILVYKKITLA